MSIAGDTVVQQFDSFLSLHGKSEEFLSFKSMEQRLDTFLHQTLNTSYPELRSFLQRLLLLSHGQTTVERGFSVNKEVETCNIKEETVEAQRLVCDHSTSLQVLTESSTFYNPPPSPLTLAWFLPFVPFLFFFLSTDES